MYIIKKLANSTVKTLEQDRSITWIKHAKFIL